MRRRGAVQPSSPRIAMPKPVCRIHTLWATKCAASPELMTRPRLPMRSVPSVRFQIRQNAPAA